MSDLTPKKTFTLVTSLIDIGREQWKYYQRDTNLYLYYLTFILNMDCNLCIFLNDKFIPFVEKYRSDMRDKTKIIPISIENLYMYKYKEKINHIMTTDEYKQNQKDPLCPEVTCPDYNIVVNSKVELVYRTAMDNPFNTDFFIWMDAGYGHGKLNIPRGFKFYPENFMNEGKVSILCLKDVNKISHDYKTFYEDHIDVVNGGFFCADLNTIEKYKTLYYYVVADSLGKDITDDDQYTVSMSYTKNNNIFSVFYNTDWYGAINQFHKNN